MSMYRIQIAPWLYQKLELKTTTYVNKGEAAAALTEALEHNGINFSIEDKGNKTSFLNEHGGELAAIVPS